MARPERNNVDYFPFYCKEGKAMHYIEQKYGNDGYATWIKILRQLAVTNNHFLNLSDRVEFMYLSSKCKLPEETLNNIINDLSDLGEINKDLWIESRVVFSEKLVESIQDAYKKRNNKCITLEGLLLLLPSLGIRKPRISGETGSGNTQSRVEYSIVERKRKKNDDNSELSERVQKYVDFINKKLNRKYRVTKKVISAFHARVVSDAYSTTEIMAVIDNVTSSTYHIGTGLKYATPEFLLRQDIIEKYKHGPIIDASAKATQHTEKPDYSAQDDFYSGFQQPLKAI